jgi:drug/metabolite transporter (DMT)-like permease
MSSETNRRPVFSTKAGSRSEAFGPAEWGLLASVALIWGSSFFFIELALEAVRPGLITWLRICAGFITLSLFPSARRRVDRQDWPRILALSMTWVTVPYLLFPIAQQHIDSALIGMLNALVPIFAAMFAAVFLRKLPRKIQRRGIALGFVGAIAISYPALQGGGSSAFGVGLIVISTVFYGLSINLAVPLQQRYGAPAVMLRALAIATLATMPFGLLGIEDSRWDVTAAVSIAVIGVMGTGIAFVAIASFVGRVGPTRGGIPIYFLPVVSIFLGVLYLAEVVAPVQIGGTLLVISGAWLTSRREES